MLTLFSGQFRHLVRKACVHNISMQYTKVYHMEERGGGAANDARY